MKDQDPSYLRAAFLLPANLVALVAALGASLWAGEPAAAIAALGAEGLFLGALSFAPAFRRAVRARSGSTPWLEEDAAGLLEELAPSQREHYFALRELRDKILANYRRLPGGRLLVATSEQRLDALLTAFLRLIATLNSYRKYLSSTDRKHVERELAELAGDLAHESNLRLKEVKAKRVEILGKRVQRFAQAQDSREVVSHQLAGIEDLLKLTHEQSIAIRDPAGVSRQLDALSAEVQATEETVREMEQFMEFSEETGPRVSHGPRVR